MKILNEHIEDEKILKLPTDISRNEEKIYRYMIESGSAATGKIRTEKIAIDNNELVVTFPQKMDAKEYYIVFISNAGRFTLTKAKKSGNMIVADISAVCDEMSGYLSDVNQFEYRVYLGFEGDGDVEIKRLYCTDSGTDREKTDGHILEEVFDQNGKFSLLVKKKKESNEIEEKQKAGLKKYDCFPYVRFFETDDFLKIVSKSNIKSGGKLVCSCYTANTKGEIELQLEEEMEAFEQISVFFVNRKNNECIYDKARIESDKKTMYLSYLNIEKYCASTNYLRWEVVVCIKKESDIYFLRVVAPVEGTGLDEISEFDKCGETIQIIPYTTQNGYFGFRTLVKEKKYMPFITCKLKRFEINGDILSMQSECPDISDYRGKWIGICFEYRKKGQEESERIFIPFETKNMNTQINLRTQELKVVQWDLRHVMEVDGQQYLVRTLCPDDFETKLEKLSSKVAVKSDSGIISMPYKTANGYFAVRSREESKYDKKITRVKEHLAVKIYELFTAYFKKKNIILVFEKFGKRAQDNGYYFFKYCMENKKNDGLNYYFIIDKDSPDYEKIKKYGKRCIKFMTLRHMIYLLAAKGMVASEAKLHAYEWFPQGSIIENRVKEKKLVFLQHGVLAMKRVDNIFGKGYSGEADVFTVSSKHEQSIVRKNFGYSKNEIKITGLARWDVLEDKSQNSKEILLFPTWRNHLDGGDREKFVQSEFYEQYQKLLSDGRLEKILRKNDVTLSFYIHPRIGEFIDYFKSSSKYIRIFSEKDIPLNELIMRTKAMITDYSSACWDTFYQGKPVIFWQFDRDEYLETQGSYVDLENEMFGKSVSTRDALIDEIESLIQDRFKMQEKYKKMQKTELEYMDKNNCQRISEVVTELFI